MILANTILVRGRHEKRKSSVTAVVHYGVCRQSEYLLENSQDLRVVKSSMSDVRVVVSSISIEFMYLSLP